MSKLQEVLTMRTKGVYAAVFSLALITGCGNQTPRRPTDNLSLLALRSDTGMELRIGLRRDSIHVGDREPVELVYVVANGPKPTRFSNEPGRFLVRLENATGAEISPASAGPPVTGSWGRDVEFLMPGSSVLGQAMNLRCIEHGAGYGEAPSEDDCVASYEFRTPGEYRLILQYYGPEVWPNLDSLKSNTPAGQVPRVEPVAQGRRMADTARLVVVQ